MEGKEVFYYDDKERAIAVFYYEKENFFRRYFNISGVETWDVLYFDDTVVEALPVLPRFDMNNKKGEAA